MTKTVCLTSSGFARIADANLYRNHSSVRVERSADIVVAAGSNPADSITDGVEVTGLSSCPVIAGISVQIRGPVHHVYKV